MSNGLKYGVLLRFSGLGTPEGCMNRGDGEVITWLTENCSGNFCHDSGYLEHMNTRISCSIVQFENEDDCIHFKFAFLDHILEWTDEAVFRYWNR